MHSLNQEVSLYRTINADHSHLQGKFYYFGENDSIQKPWVLSAVWHNMY